MKKIISARYVWFAILVGFCALSLSSTTSRASGTAGDSTHIQYGDCIEASLDSVGEVDKYTFVADSGDIVTIRMRSSWKYSTCLELYDPEGVRISRPTGDYYVRIDTLKLVATGIYTLLALDTGGDDKGSYGLHLQRVLNPEGADTLVYGETVESSISSWAEMDAYVFVADSGDIVTIRMRSSWKYSTCLELYDPEGVRISRPTGDYYVRIDTLKLVATGIYTLLALDTGGDDKGSYGLHLQRVLNPEGADTLVYGETVESSISSWAEMDAYVFVADSGDIVTIRMRSSWKYSTCLELYDPEGVRISRPTGDYYVRIDTLKLVATGIYTLLALDTGGDDKGSYGLHLQRVLNPEGADTLVYGETVESSISSWAEMDAYVFVADSGDIVTIRMRSSWKYSTCLELYDPEGVRISRPTGDYYVRIDTLKLVATGIYTLLALDTGGDDKGSYGLHLQRVLNPEGADTLVYGETVESSISSWAEMDAYVFVADSGDIVTIRMRSSWKYSTCLELYDPEGVRISRPTGDYYVRIDTLKLVATGIYTLLALDTGGDDKGSYGLHLQRVLNPEGADTLVYGETVESSISSWAEMDAYVFVADSGDIVTIRMRSSWKYSTCLELYDPEGVRISRPTGDYYVRIDTLKLVATGIYTLLALDTGGDNTGTYDLSLDQVSGVKIIPGPPSPDFVDFPIDEYIRVTFTEPIDASTIASNTFFITSSKAGDIRGNRAYDSLTYVLEFRPESFFHPYDTVCVTLTDSVRDLSGNKLRQTYVWCFVTGPGVYPGDTNNDGVVNEVDVLPLGIFWSETGLYRDSTGTDWTIKPVKQPWLERAATYADANGDGVVDIEDLDAIRRNWDSTHAYANPTLTPEELDSLAEYYLNKDALEQLCDGLKEDNSESGVKIREILETVIISPGTPDGFSLSQNYPNPFNPETEIEYFLPADCEVELVIYNVLGEKVRTLVSKVETAGLKRVNWDGTNDEGESIASGVYFYRIKAGEFTQFKKMLLLR